MFDSLDHVDLRVADRAAARAFFVDRLGLKLLADGPAHTFLLVGDDVLGLHDAAPGEALHGVDHVALRVALWEGLRTRLETAGVRVTAEKERDDSRSLFVEGPEGLQVELVHRPHPERHPDHPMPRRARKGARTGPG